jgi:hypothetical protein
MSSQVSSTLIGVALGAALAFIASYFNERAKWNRSHAVRWDERRLTTYVEYAGCIRRMQWLASRIAAGRGLTTGAEPLESTEGMTLLSEAEISRSERWQEVVLLGSKAAIEVGFNLNRCTWTLEWFARGKLEDSQDWQLVSREAHRLRREFSFAARKDMGVAGANMDVPAWQEQWDPETLLTPLREQAKKEGSD